MSDSVTNVEIEDVLSSIRRLVSDGDKARTRDPAPVEDDEDIAPNASHDSAESSESKPDKFVLTPALMVVTNDTTEKSEQDSAPDAAPEGENAGEESHGEDGEDAGWVEELPDEPEVVQDDIIQHGDDDDVAEPESDFEPEETGQESGDDHAAFSEDAIADDTADDADDLEDDEPDDMIWGSVDEARKIGLAAVPAAGDDKANTTKATDRSGLIASIAELEAAVSKDVNDFEPDGSEVMGETIAWPGTVRRNTENAQDAEEADEPEVDQADEVETVEVEQDAATAEEAKQEPPVKRTDASDEYDDDDLDGLLDAGGANLDEDALRGLVAEIVREELAGQMGERITRNVRKLVRREIYRILSSQEFD